MGNKRKREAPSVAELLDGFLDWMNTDGKAVRMMMRAAIVRPFLHQFGLRDVQTEDVHRISRRVFAGMRDYIRNLLGEKGRGLRDGLESAISGLIHGGKVDEDPTYSIADINRLAVEMVDCDEPAMLHFIKTITSAPARMADYLSDFLVLYRRHFILDEREELKWGLVIVLYNMFDRN